MKTARFVTRPFFYVPALVVVLAAAAVLFYFSPFEKAAEDLIEAKRGDIRQEVSVTGRVKPAESVELAFEKSGRVARLGAGVGDKVFAGQILVALENAELSAQLEQARADLKAEEADLAELEMGPRPEDLEVARAKVSRTHQNLLDKLEDAYTKSDDAVRNRVDQFFSNPQTPNPKVTFITDGATALEAGRVTVGSVLEAWQERLAGVSANSSDLKASVLKTKGNLGIVKNFLDQAAAAVNALKAGGSLSQATIDAYRSDVSTARTNLNTAINNLSSAEADWIIASGELAVKEAGASAQELLAQEARVEKTRAGIKNIEAQLAKTFIRAPFSGKVTRSDAKIGEIVAAGAGQVSVMSESDFEIEANVPEADIAKIKVGAGAKVTLDAYGSDVVFEAKVGKIDPAETIIEGVTTYKITLLFSSRDERLRSGMTANVDVGGERRDKVIVIPQRAVISKDGGKFVRVLKDGKIEEVKVTTGLRGSDGNIEIISGISEGERIIVSGE